MYLYISEERRGMLMGVKGFFRQNTVLFLITGLLFLALTPDVVGQTVIEHFPSKPTVGESLQIRIEALFPSTCWYELVFDSTVVRDSVINVYSTAHYSCPPVCVCFDVIVGYEFKTHVGSFSSPGNYTIVSVISVIPPGHGGPFIKTCDFTVGESPTLDGDLNFDNLLSPADVVLELLCFFSKSPPPTGLPSCDIDGDGITTYPDTIGLINAVFLNESIWHHCSP